MKSSKEWATELMAEVGCSSKLRIDNAYLESLQRTSEKLFALAQAEARREVLEEAAKTSYEEAKTLHDAGFTAVMEARSGIRQAIRALAEKETK